MADDLKSEVKAKCIEVAQSKKTSIIESLEQLEKVLYDIGVDGVKPKKAHNDDNIKHVSSLERAKNDIRAHYAGI